MPFRRMRSKLSAPPGDLAHYFLCASAAPSLESLVAKAAPPPAPHPEAPASLALARFVLLRLGLPLDDVLASAVLAGCSPETLDYFQARLAPKKADQVVVVLEQAAAGGALKQRPATATTLRSLQRSRMGGTGGSRRPASAAK